MGGLVFQLISALIENFSGVASTITESCVLRLLRVHVICLSLSNSKRVVVGAPSLCQSLSGFKIFKMNISSVPLKWGSHARKLLVFSVIDVNEWKVFS